MCGLGILCDAWKDFALLTRLRRSLGNVITSDSLAGDLNDMQYASGSDRSDDVGIDDGGGRDARAGGIDDVFASPGGNGTPCRSSGARGGAPLSYTGGIDDAVTSPCDNGRVGGVGRGDTALSHAGGGDDDDASIGGNPYKPNEKPCATLILFEVSGRADSI